MRVVRIPVEAVSADNSILRVTCQDKDTEEPMDLTDRTAVLRWYIGSSSDVVDSTMEIVGDEEDGVVQYQFAEGELVPGVLHFEVKLYDLSGERITQIEPTLVKVREEYPEPE